jgi:hypothetical protein
MMQSESRLKKSKVNTDSELKQSEKQIEWKQT